MQKIPEFSDIKNAHERIKPFINRTPVLSSSSINRILGAEIYLSKVDVGLNQFVSFSRLKLRNRLDLKSVSLAYILHSFPLVKKANLSLLRMIFCTGIKRKDTDERKVLGSQFRV